MKQFKKPESNPLLNAIDFFNFYGSFALIFEGVKHCHMLSENEACLMDSDNLNEDYTTKPTFILKDEIVKVVKNNSFDLAVGCKMSKFMLLVSVKFKGDTSMALSFVEYHIMKREIPYIRVGTDYFKVIKKEDRYKGVNVLLKSWDKSEIKEDHGKALLKMIFKFDDFTIIPNNTEFIPVKNNCYNLYSKFSHEPYTGRVETSDVPITMGLLSHIFKEHIDLGLTYMKVLYEYPRQILPVLALVSSERETGKTTFLNWIQMIFGENSTLINPTDLMSNFNDGYATKNIIMIDETVIEKQHVVEKLKSIATAKTMSVSQKFVSHYSVPFFGKVIVSTNKEKDFMKIDEEEIRFWIRRVEVIEGDKNTNIENDLFSEIPKFLRLLLQLPVPDFSKSRMVFTKEEISTQHLSIIKDNSKTSTRKDLEIFIDEFFDSTGKDTFEASLTDIKNRWFQYNNQIGLDWLRNVLIDQMKISPAKMKKYIPFDNDGLPKTGRAYTFTRKNDETVHNQEIMGFEEVYPF